MLEQLELFPPETYSARLDFMAHIGCIVIYNEGGDGKTYLVDTVRLREAYSRPGRLIPIQEVVT